MDEASAAPGVEANSVAPAVTLIERVTIVGSDQDAFEIPGSATVLSHEDLERQGHTDIHRALQQVPGVILQDEDGFGLRPNIGLRGTGVERSQKITLLEDGVLIAPAPYTAPAAYYFPTVSRMESIEVRKGTASVIEGPYTVGGAINLLTSAIPGTFGGRGRVSVGENQTLRTHALLGDSRDRFGWMVEGVHDETDGFKSLDRPSDGGGVSGDTGFELDDVLTKLRFSTTPGDGWSQSFELKLGKTQQFGHETYLGLTDADLRAIPDRRYAASSQDTIDTDHELGQLRWVAMPTRHLDLTVTAYRADFFRDWFKNESTGGISNSRILASPLEYADQLAILRGEEASEEGALALRHNRRNYRSQGVQARFGLSIASDHQFEFGIRWHEDEEDRFQEEDRYSMLGPAPGERFGVLELFERGAPGSQTNRVSGARATAIFVQDTWTAGRFTVVPGVRWESIDYRRLDYSKADPLREAGPTRDRRNDEETLIPGIGLTYRLTERQRLFAGAYRGFSPPGAGRTEETDAETSVNVEFGHRYSSGRLRTELVGFWNDYDNLLGVETVSGGGGFATELFNGGAVDVRGVEASASWNLAGSGNRLEAPVRVAYTFTEAEFGTSFETSFADWAPSVERGDELPYLPEQQLSLSVGVAGAKLGADVSASWQSASRAKAGRGPIAANELIDERWVVDVSGRWQLHRRVALDLKVRNLLDETYVVARRPYGARPGLERTALLGVRLDF